MSGKELCQIEGTVDCVVYNNEENGFAVLTLDADGEPVTVVGEIGNVDEGEDLSLTGEFVNHPKFGEQFKVTLCERKMPTTALAIRKYLSSGAIKGIGPVMAGKIVDEFGDMTLEIMEKEPYRLCEVEGITKKKCQKISDEFKNVNGVRLLMGYLSKFGIPAGYGAKAWKRWGQPTEDIIRNNPYVLCAVGIELPFFKADEMAAAIELPKDNENRIRAGITNVLIQNSYAGHTCLPEDKLRDITCKFLEIEEDKFNEVLEEEIKEENLFVFTKKTRPFILLKDFYTAENYISRRLSIMKECLYDSKINYDEIIALAEEQNDIRYEELQKKAINTALSCGFLVMTGGPGTGKTTTLNAIISLFEQQGLNVLITAPTGRAAKRISDLTGYEAKTIHRMLEVKFSDGDRPHFNHNENNLLDCDVMIIDEMSMVDSLLFEALLRAIPMTCKLIMVGDSDQLPSVGAGNVLKDIIDSEVVPVITLKEIFRQASQSSIIVNAHKIVRGEHIDLSQKDNDFFFFQRLKHDDLQSLVVQLTKDRLPKAYGYSPIDDIQILSPTRKGPSGTVELNKKLQAELNPPSKEKSEIKTFQYIYRVGDKVMQTKNNYDIVWSKDLGDGVKENGSGIFNGDIGIIIAANKYTGIITIDFEGRICNYTVSMLEHLDLAYAVTVHKSQGSEFDVVILTVFGGFDKLYYRNLLYTAVTRAKKLLIIVGSAKKLDYMIENNRRTLRYTVLKNKLIQDGNSDELTEEIDFE